MQDIIQLVMIGLGQGALYALIALGFVLIYKCSAIVNVAQGNLVLLGGYLGFAFTGQLGLPWFAAIPLILLSLAFLSVLIERFTLRPMIGQPPLAMILMTLGLASVIQGGTVMVWGGAIQKGPPLTPSGGLNFFGIMSSYESALSIVLAAVLMLIFAWYFKTSRTGLRMRAVADDGVAAQSLGVRLSSIYRTSWIIAAGVAGLGGTVLGSIGGVHLGLSEMGLKSIVVVLLGGLESIFGVIVAGPIVGLIEAFAIQYLDPFVGGGIKDAVVFAILIPTLIVLPYGLFGWKNIERV